MMGHATPRWDLWSARCPETGTAGAGGGSGKPTSGNTGRAPRVDLTAKFSWTDIVRHTLVTGGASPDDPALAGYWAARRRRIKPPLDGYTLRLLAKQNGQCPLCGDELLSADQPPQSPHEWERWPCEFTAILRWVCHGSEKCS